MIRPPRTTYWPNLAYRVARTMVAESRERFLESVRKTVLEVVEKDKALTQTELLGPWSEEEFIQHLREPCVDCRRAVAHAVRMGAKMSHAILQAAGVEVLN
jgi:hypothetical protein